MRRTWSCFLVNLFLSTLCVALLWPVSSHAASGNIPLDSEVYEILDLLTAKGYLRTHLAGTRPITYGEAYRLLDEARGKMREPFDPAYGGTRGREGKRGVPPSVVRALQRLEYHILGSLQDGTGLFPFKRPEFTVQYLEGEPSSIPGIKSSQHALVYNNEGFDPNEGTTGTLTFESEAALGSVHLQIYPRLTTADEDRDFIHRGYAKVDFLGMELGAGKESLWWGQGRHGGLYLTSNAEPLLMVRLTNESPSELPWVFKYLGPFRFDLFVSRLEEDRAVPEPYFAGIRLNFRPVYEFELGMSMMVMTGGEGRPPFKLADLFEILFGENEIGNEDRSNKIAGIDFRFNLPGWQIYGEAGGEDEAGGWPAREAVIIGVYLPRLTRTADLRFEFADLAWTKDSAGAWYKHGIYTDGYTYNGRILGHHVGGDGKDLFTEVTLDLGEGARARFGLDLERRGVFAPMTEQHLQFMVGYEHRLGLLGSGWKGEVSAAVDQVKNAGYVEGEEGTVYYLSLAVMAPIL